MRTTLTLDDDVIAALERRRVAHGTRLRDEVNTLLRAGLAATAAAPGSTDPFTVPTFDPGRQLITDRRELIELLDSEDIERGLPART